MSEYLLMCRSLTYAQRSQRVLGRNGIYASLLRAPEELRGDGCGYALGLREYRLRDVSGLLRDAGLPVGKLYRRTESGYEESAL